MTTPNIVLLIFDDWEVEELQRMPQLARLSATGVNFLQAFSTTALCQPARATFLTGQYAHNNGVLDNNTITPLSSLDHTTMLPARLQAAGYQTCHIGKYLNSWGSADPIPAGWNEWHALSQSFYFGYSVNDNGVVTSPPEYHTTTCKNRALSYITSATQPFFMQVGFKCPHNDNPTLDTNQLNATPDVVYNGVTPTSRLAPRNPNFNVTMGTPPAYMAHAAMDSTKIDAVDTFWRGKTEMMYSGDRAVQAISEALVAAGMTNTIIIVTSDHGYFHGEGRNPAGKVAPYLPSMRVPLIISGPGSLVAQNKVCYNLVAHVDIAPTIYALTGATSVRVVDGGSLVPMMTNPGGPTIRNYLLHEWLGSGNANSGTGWGVKIPICHLMISSTYFYSSYITGEEELYDLVADPYQLTNVAGISTYSGVKADFASRLNSSKSCVGNSCRLM